VNQRLDSAWIFIGPSSSDVIGKVTSLHRRYKREIEFLGMSEELRTFPEIRLQGSLLRCDIRQMGKRRGSLNEFSRREASPRPAGPGEVGRAQNPHE
jgi:hypothetical protein